MGLKLVILEREPQQVPFGLIRRSNRCYNRWNLQEGIINVPNLNRAVITR